MGEKPIPSPLRIQDKYLAYLRKFLMNTVIESIDLDQKDRILRFNYIKRAKRCSFLVFFNKKSINFANIYFDPKKELYLVFRSWQNKTTPKEDSKEFELFDSLGRKDLERKIDKDLAVNCEKLLLQEQEARSLESSKIKKKMRRKVENIEQDLKQLRSYKDMAEYVESGQDLSQLPTKFRRGFFKIHFKDQDHFKRRDQIYTKIKRLKKAEPDLIKRFEQAKRDLEKQRETTVLSTQRIYGPKWYQAKIKKIEVREVSDYKVYQFEGFKIAVGNSAKGNDQLRSQWASKSDIWFHLEGEKSAHAIYKSDSQEILNPSKLNLIASIVMEFSGLNGDSCDIVYCQVKNLKGVKGAPGKVIYKKEKRFRAVKTNWKSFLSNSAS